MFYKLGTVKNIIIVLGLSYLISAQSNQVALKSPNGELNIKIATLQGQTLNQERG